MISAAALPRVITSLVTGPTAGARTVDRGAACGAARILRTLSTRST